MSQEKTTVESSVVAVYHDQTAAEHALRQLHEAGFATSDLSIVGRDFQMSEQPIGFISAWRLRICGSGGGRLVRRAVRPLRRRGVPRSAGFGPRRDRRPLGDGDSGGHRRCYCRHGTGQPRWSVDRLGDTQGTGSQVRDPRQGGQVPRDRTRRAAGHCPGPRIARSPACGSCRSFRCRRVSTVISPKHSSRPL